MWWCGAGIVVTLPVFVGTGKPRSHQCAATSGKQRMDDLQQSLQSDDETMTCKNVCLHKASSYSCWISKRLMAAALFPSKPMMEVANSKCPGRSFIIWRLFWTWWIHVIAVSLWVCNKIVGPLQHVSISWTDIISLSFWVLLAPLLDAFEAARIETSFPNIKDSLQLQISIQAVHHTSSLSLSKMIRRCFQFNSASGGSNSCARHHSNCYLFDLVWLSISKKDLRARKHCSILE